MRKHLRLGRLVAAGILTLGSCDHRATFSRASLPMGSVDLPQPKSTVQSTLQVSGWAVAHEPIQAVSVYIDGEFVSAVPVGIARPDVAAAKPGFKNAANSGFSVSVDSATIAPGWHEIVVQARTEGGAARDLATVPILVQR